MKTACVVLNYKGTSSALRLVESLKPCQPAYVFIVENGSNDGSYEILCEKLGPDTIVKLDVNAGFAGGMNAGIRRALQTDAEAIWLLSKDITVEPDCLSVLTSLYSRLQNPGFLGSLTDLNKTENIYFAGAKIESSGDVYHNYENQTVNELPDAEYLETDYVNGSCVFAHRSVYEKVGLISEDYFLYFEDTDWGLAAQRAGYQNYVSLRSRVHHYRNSAAYSRTAEYYCRRNAFLFRKRNGLLKPWTKMFEMLKVQKYLLKARLFGQKERVEVLKHVFHDLKHERFGLGPYR